MYKSQDDYIDSAGGDDTIDGKEGDDTLLIFEDSSEFTITTLAGVTKIEGSGWAGDYAYDLITMTNVEQIQFTDKNIEVDTTTYDVIEGSWRSETITGTSGDDYIERAGGDAPLEGKEGHETVVITSLIHL